MIQGRIIWATLCTGCLLLLLASGQAAGQNATDWTTSEDVESVQERRILVSLKEERQKLQRKRKKLTERKSELKVMRQEVEKRLKRMRQWREDLKGLLEEKEQKEQKRVQKLSRIYQRMDPLKAAEALGSVERDLAVAVLSRMRSGTAAEVLNNMDKEQAASLSTDLSQLEGQEKE